MRYGTTQFGNRVDNVKLSDIGILQGSEQFRLHLKTDSRRTWHSSTKASIGTEFIHEGCEESYGCFGYMVAEFVAIRQNLAVGRDRQSFLINEIVAELQRMTKARFTGGLGITQLDEIQNCFECCLVGGHDN